MTTAMQLQIVDDLRPAWPNGGVLEPVDGGWAWRVRVGDLRDAGWEKFEVDARRAWDAAWMRLLAEFYDEGTGSGERRDG